VIVFAFIGDIGVVKIQRDIEDIRQISKAIAAARCATAMKQQRGMYVAIPPNIHLFVQFFLKIYIHQAFSTLQENLPIVSV